MFLECQPNYTAFDDLFSQRIEMRNRIEALNWALKEQLVFHFTFSQVSNIENDKIIVEKPMT